MRCALGLCFGVLNGGDDDEDSNDDDDDNDDEDDDDSMLTVVEYIRNKYSHPDACVVQT